MFLRKTFHYLLKITFLCVASYAVEGVDACNPACTSGTQTCVKIPAINGRTEENICVNNTLPACQGTQPQGQQCVVSITPSTTSQPTSTAAWSTYTCSGAAAGTCVSGSTCIGLNLGGKIQYACMVNPDLNATTSSSGAAVSSSTTPTCNPACASGQSCVFSVPATITAGTTPASHSVCVAASNGCGSANPTGACPVGQSCTAFPSPQNSSQLVYACAAPCGGNTLGSCPSGQKCLPNGKQTPGQPMTFLCQADGSVSNAVAANTQDLFCSATNPKGPCPTGQLCVPLVTFQNNLPEKNNKCMEISLPEGKLLCGATGSDKSSICPTGYTCQGDSSKGMWCVDAALIDSNKNKKLKRN